MYIRKKKNNQVTIYFDKEDEYGVTIDLDVRSNEDPDFDEPILKDMQVTVTKIDDYAIQQAKIHNTIYSNVEQGSLLKDFLKKS